MKQTLNNIKAKLKSTSLGATYLGGQSITALEWIALALLSLFLLVAFDHHDIDCILDNTVIFVRSITDGKFTQFYDINVTSYSSEWPGNYDISVYIFMAVWNLPTIILGYFIPINYTKNFVCLAWMKTLILLFILLTAVLIFKILTKAGVERKHAVFGMFLFSSSLVVLTFTMLVSQMDLIPTFFALLGVYYFMQEKYRGFIIAFAVAIPLKLFAIFIFVPLVLLHYKKVIHIIGAMVSVMIIPLLCKLPFRGSVAYEYMSKSLLSLNISRLLKTSVSGTKGAVPIFILLFVIVCVYCYITKIEDMKRFYRRLFYISFFVFTSFILFTDYNIYWAILYTPFMIVTIMLNPRFLKVNMLLELFASLFNVLFCMCVSVGFSELFPSSENMLLPVFIKTPQNMERKYNSVNQFLNTSGISEYRHLFFALFVGAMLAMLIINFPRRQDNTVGNTEKVDYGLVWCRIGALFAVTCLMTFCFLKTANVPIYNTTEKSAAEIDANILRGNVISQKFIPERSITAEEITLKFKSTKSSTQNTSTVSVTLSDSDGNKLFERKMGTNLLDNNRDWTIDIGKIQLDSDKEYTVTISGDKGNNSDSLVAPIITEKAVKNLLPTELNGEKQVGSLYMKVR